MTDTLVNASVLLQIIFDANFQFHQLSNPEIVWI